MAQETKSIDSVSNYSLELRFFVSRSRARAFSGFSIMKDIRAHNYRKCQRKKLAGTIFTFIFLAFTPSPPLPSIAARDCLSSACCLRRGTLVRPSSPFFFAPLGKLRSEEKSGGSSKFPLETRSCDSAIPCRC